MLQRVKLAPGLLGAGFALQFQHGLQAIRAQLLRLKQERLTRAIQCARCVASFLQQLRIAVQPDQQLAARVRAAVQLAQTDVRQLTTCLALAQAQHRQAALDRGCCRVLAVTLLPRQLLGHAQRLAVPAGAQQHGCHVQACPQLGAVPLRATALGIHSVMGARAGRADARHQGTRGSPGAELAIGQSGLLGRQCLKHAHGQLQIELAGLNGHRQRPVRFGQGRVMPVGGNLQWQHRDPGLGFATCVLVRLGSDGSCPKLRQCLLQAPQHHGQIASRHQHPVLQRRVAGLPGQGHGAVDPARSSRQLAGELKHGGLQSICHRQGHRVAAALADLAQFGDCCIGHRSPIGRAMRIAPGPQEGHQITAARRARGGLQRGQAIDHLLGRVAMLGLDGFDLPGHVARAGLGAGQRSNEQQQS